ncbi:hypothetical protein THASP1DRAFT_25859, partial [Thamnocephalis sphaerospora]
MSTQAAATMPSASSAKPSRMQVLPVYACTYPRLVNFSDLNAADHLDAAVICRYIADATMQFWIELFRMPQSRSIDITQWLARVSGYEARGVSRVVMANLEQRVRYVAEGFRLETVNVDVAVRTISASGCVLAHHLYVERPGSAGAPPRRHTIAIAE